MNSTFFSLRSATDLPSCGREREREGKIEREKGIKEEKESKGEREKERRSEKGIEQEKERNEEREKRRKGEGVRKMRSGWIHFELNIWHVANKITQKKHIKRDE